jgi:hypothetical protein
VTLHAALLIGMLLGGAPAASPSVTCLVRDDPQGRTFVLEPSGPDAKSWRLSMQDRESAGKWVRLALPGASPALARGTASLRYKNANGGRQVTVDVGSDHTRLEVYVDHGLEVNIEPDLDPAVDRMNTNGPLTALDCTVADRAGQ